MGLSQQVCAVKCTFEKQTPHQVFTGWLCIGKHLCQSVQINILIEYFLRLCLLWPCACTFLIKEICQCLFKEFNILGTSGICLLYCRFSTLQYSAQITVALGKLSSLLFSVEYASSKSALQSRRHRTSPLGR